MVNTTGYSDVDSAEEENRTLLGGAEISLVKGVVQHAKPCLIMFGQILVRNGTPHFNEIIRLAQ